MQALTQPSPARGRGPEAGRFAEAAARLAGLAGALIGWRPGEFWSATPAELAAILGVLAPEEERATADDLQRLMEMFPDSPSRHSGGGRNP